MLRWRGGVLLGLGGAIGFVVGLTVLTEIAAGDSSWIIDAGIAKLGLLASGALTTAGAVCLRLDRRERKRQRRAFEAETPGA
jgi:hypothetical protein